MSYSLKFEDTLGHSATYYGKEQSIIISVANKGDITELTVTDARDGKLLLKQARLGSEPHVVIGVGLPDGASGFGPGLNADSA